jgi:hypothetical protein
MNVTETRRRFALCGQDLTLHGESLVSATAPTSSGTIMRALAITTTFLGVAAFLAIFSGLIQQQSTEGELQYTSYTEGAVQVGHRELRYNLFGGGEVATTQCPPAASVSFERGTVMLDESGVRVDNGSNLLLPSDSKIVRVHFSDGQLHISADGKRIYFGDFPSAAKLVQ